MIKNFLEIIKFIQKVHGCTQTQLEKLGLSKNNLKRLNRKIYMNKFPHIKYFDSEDAYYTSDRWSCSNNEDLLANVDILIEFIKVFGEDLILIDKDEKTEDSLNFYRQVIDENEEKNVVKFSIIRCLPSNETLIETLINNGKFQTVLLNLDIKYIDRYKELNLNDNINYVYTTMIQDNKLIMAKSLDEVRNKVNNE